MTGIPPEATPPSPPNRNESRDRAAIRALGDIDPELASLFVAARDLCNQPDATPALAYLIAHVGRELSNGLIRALTPAAKKAPIEQKDDQIRDRLGKAFGLP